MNLLIVDDEYLVVEEVVTVTDWGMLGITEIYSATNAVSAVRILNEKKIDIMICDIEMPQTDGLELSKSISVLLAMEIYKRYVSVRRGECHKRVDSMATGIQEQSSGFY